LLTIAYNGVNLQAQVACKFCTAQKVCVDCILTAQKVCVDTQTIMIQALPLFFAMRAYLVY
jgi:hypothetical protein